MMGRYNETDIHPVALALTLAMALAFFVVRRDRAAIPLLLVACLIPHTQRLVVGGFDFSMLRIMIVFGWARVMFLGEMRDYRHHRLDTIVVIWLIFGTIAYTFGPRGSIEYFVQRLGTVFDAAGIYFLFRILLRDVKDVQRTIEVFSWLALLMMGPIIFEFMTGRNLFAFLGGVPEFTHIRNGRLRCQASFSHPIMAGTFGVTTLALLGGLWVGLPKQRLRTGMAIIAALSVTVLSASSGPLLATGAAILGWALWPYRHLTRVFLWSTIAGIVVIHFAREQPFWHLIGRISSITGGTGWHRVALIDAFVEHFHEWWFLGTLSTAHWKGAQAMDITNQYLLEGIRGGLPTLIMFLVLFIVAFRTTGQSVATAMRRQDWSRQDRKRAAVIAWALGVCLAVHCIAFIGVSYFGQLISILYLHLAMVPSLAVALTRDAKGKRAPQGSGGRKRRPARPPEPQLDEPAPGPSMAFPTARS